MPILTFEGSITQTLFDSQGVAHTPPPPSSFVPGTCTGYSFNLNFNDDLIVWGKNTPITVQQLTLSNLLSNPLFTVTINTNIRIMGEQSYNDSSFPTTTGIFTAGPATAEDIVVKEYQPPSPGSIGTSTYNVNDNIPNFNPRQLCIFLFNECSPGLPGCNQFGATGYTFIVSLEIRVQANCTGTSLLEQTCIDFCNQPENANSCLSDYVDFCLVPTAPNTIRLETSMQCQEFIQDYIENIGPTAQIDLPLQTYCSNKYMGFGDLFSSNNAVDKQACACNMPSGQYVNYVNQLEMLFPGYAAVPGPDECFLDQCKSSPYKTTTTTKVCPVPACVNIVSFTNRGTFDNSKVTIIQGASGCENITGQGDGNGNGNGESFVDRYRFLLIGLGVGLLVFIIIIIVLLLV